MSERLWTAGNFLRAASEFERMTPDRATWTEQHLAENPPRRVRLRRLHALAKAFDIQPGFEALWSGDFIARRPFERYERLRQRVQEDCETRFPDVLHTARGKSLSSQGVTWSYRKLFEFLVTHAYPMLNVNGGVLEASGYFLYPLYQVDEVLKGLPEKLRPIEEVVGLIIEPDGRAFTEEELAAHGWPEEDLSEIDAEWS